MTKASAQHSSNTRATNGILGISTDFLNDIRLISALEKDRLAKKLIANSLVHTHTLTLKNNIYIKEKKLLASNSSSQVFSEESPSKKLIANSFREEQ